MSQTHTLRRPGEANRWTVRDLLLVFAALLLLALAILALARRDEFLATASSGPRVIATLRTADFHALAFAPDDNETVYFGHHNGILKSINGGVDWTAVLNKGDAMSLAILPDAPNVVIAAGHLVFLRSDDRGATWKEIPNDLPYTDIHGFAINPNDTREWFAHVVGYGLFRSTDQGAHWSHLADTLPQTTMALVVVPGDVPTLYAGTMDQGVLSSTNRGQTWSRTNLGSKMVMTLTQNNRDPRILFAGTQAGLYRSDTEGKSWTRVGLDGKNLMAIAISRVNSSRLIAVDDKGRVYRSDDGGMTW